MIAGLVGEFRRHAGVFPLRSCTVNFIKAQYLYNIILPLVIPLKSNQPSLPEITQHPRSPLYLSGSSQLPRPVAPGGPYTISIVQLNTTPLGLKTDGADTLESALTAADYFLPNLSINDMTYYFNYSFCLANANHMSKYL